MIYLQLFISFFQIGLFSFGGGYAILPMIQQQVVQLHQWITPSELTDMVVISQMTPGPVAINTATFVGTKIAGPFGGVIATFGCVFPSAILVTALSFYFFKNRSMGFVQDALNGIRPAVVAMIAVAAVDLVKSALLDNTGLPSINLYSFLNLNFFALVLLLAALALLIKKKMGVMTSMAASGVLGLIFYIGIGILR